ncbi:hypothetical protein [Mycobacterium tuberculosis]|nr:hypothetical protein [Mycobacterium tuberculosis]AGQ37172.1 hypothetical protein M943_07530 [Mycobacterium tuberculosis EAI5]AKR01145.1 hypothetical protein Mb1595_p1622 [Mycobacterium tuberculosis variant bovis]ESK72963.1 hypothetical protein O217_07870 [Mycobacterium tuberculosis variant bovis AN5]ESK76530.1 hypothetical protein O216_08015 [Mycobacterium tuberculosis variant bovis 04-303]EUA96036.1 hypothetical protein Z028_07780 [Mycobacterium tuberculosis INS_MDR]EUA96371.1 hypothetica
MEADDQQIQASVTFAMAASTSATRSASTTSSTVWNRSFLLSKW